MHARSSMMMTVIAIAVMSGSAAAQSAKLTVAKTDPNTSTTPAQMLQPHSASPLLAPVNLNEDAELLPAKKPAQPQPVMTGHHGPGFGLMIAGGALFVAGLLTGGTAGTVMDLAGAGIGAYGLYVYFK
jgi:hypothetical protein